MDKEITIREALVLVDRLIKMRERLQEQIKERNCYIAKPENSKKINALIGKYTMLTQAIPKIRARIQKANIPILDQIYFIRFQKSEIEFYESLKKHSHEEKKFSPIGVQKGSLSYECSLTFSDIDTIIDNLRSGLYVCEDEINRFNNTQLVPIEEEYLMLVENRN
jgi:hypothetical protein